jgi:glycosyltransferase involved in cell wall biosynthesis
MKIVLFEDFFHPHAGYGINLLSQYFSLQGHEVVIFTSEINKTPSSLRDFFDLDDIEKKDEVFTNRHGVKIYRVKTYFYFSGRAIVTSKLFQWIKNESPDLLLISGNDTYIGILATLNYSRMSVPLVFKSSMVEMASVNRFSKLFRMIYKRIISPLIIKNNLVIIRTQDDPYVINFLGIPIKQAPFISFGVDTRVFSPVKDKSTLRYKYEIPNNTFVIIYAGKLDSSKGVELLIDVFMSPLEASKNTSLIVVGSVNSEIKESFNNFLLSCPNQIFHFPTQQYETLSEFYAMSDLAIFPKQISLSFFNAQASGLPVVAEMNNINQERLSHNNGLVFENDNSLDMREKILHIANLSCHEYGLMSKRAIEYVTKNFDYGKISLQYLDLFENERNRQLNLTKLSK